MKKNSKLTFLEKGEVLDEMSLDFILGGQSMNLSEESGCDHCDTCAGSNNSGNSNPSQLEGISVG